MDLQSILEGISSSKLPIDNIEIVRVNLVTGPTWEQKNDQYRQIHKEVIDLSEKLDSLINQIDFENIIQNPPF